MKLAALLAALSLLLAPVTASAECAWVLWLERTGSPVDDKWTAVYASASIRECDQSLKSMMSANTKPRNTDKIELLADNMFSKESTSLRTFIIYRYVCLPDTVDPRGPKGR